MDLASIFHESKSQLAYASGKHDYTFRLRSKAGDLRKAIFFYGDTAYPAPKVPFVSVTMERSFAGSVYDYYSVHIETDVVRLVYGFELAFEDGGIIYYYGERFHENLSMERNDYFKFPYNREEELPQVPPWLRSAVFYNIFPDSFVTSKRRENRSSTVGGISVNSHHGGTLNDVVSKLDYIRELGCNALYFNPFFLAGAYHKYDTVDYLRLDPLIGDEKDLFALVEGAHNRGMHIIIDGVFNHCGSSFFAFLDVLKNQQNSPYCDWFYHLSFPVVYPPAKGERPNYACFGYEKDMPKLNTSNQEVISYFLKVIDKWIGAFHIDGFRFDTSDEVNDDFWRIIHRHMRELNPDSALIGEVWQNPNHWLSYDMFDSAMNYDFRRALLGYLKDDQGSAWLDDYVAYLLMRQPRPYAESMLNLLSTHDVPRLFSLLGEDKGKMSIAFAFVFTFVGAVNIFYGDENGFTGVEEDECRRPMKFPQSPLFASLIKDLSSLRLAHKAFVSGNFKTIEKTEDLYVFSRSGAEETFIVCLNPSPSGRSISSYLKEGEIALSYGLDGKGFLADGFAIIKKV